MVVSLFWSIWLSSRLADVPRMSEVFFSERGLLFSSDKVESGISFSILDFRVCEYLVETVLDELMLLALLAAWLPTPSLLLTGLGILPEAIDVYLFELLSCFSPSLFWSAVFLATNSRRLSGVVYPFLLFNYFFDATDGSFEPDPTKLDLPRVDFDESLFILRDLSASFIKLAFFFEITSLFRDDSCFLSKSGLRLSLTLSLSMLNFPFKPL